MAHGASRGESAARPDDLKFPASLEIFRARRVVREQIPDREWRWAQAHLPLTHVDILPVRRRPGARGVQIGLIQRWYPDERSRPRRLVWCVAGGRLGYREPIRAAIAREIRADLGARTRPSIPRAPAPLRVVEYFPRAVSSSVPHDPRKHAIGLLYAIPLKGQVRPRGQAVAFAWFEARRLPPPVEIGFGLSATLRACARELSRGT